jgi:hypothetical protein
MSEVLARVRVIEDVLHLFDRQQPALRAMAGAMKATATLRPKAGGVV